MAIVQCVPDSQLLAFAKGVGDFQAAGDTFKMALYLATASLGTGTTAYTADGEVSGTGYSAGGATLTSVDPVVSNNKTVFDFTDLTFSALTVTGIAGAMIYNSSQSNAVVAILKFTTALSPSAQDVVVTFPGAASTSAILRLRQVANG